jgi:hypothetical protein
VPPKLPCLMCSVVLGRKDFIRVKVAAVGREFRPFEGVAGRHSLKVGLDSPALQICMLRPTAGR